MKILRIFLKKYFQVIIDCKGRAGHTTFLLGDQLYIFGGYNDMGEVFHDMFSINLASGTVKIP